MLFNLKKDDEVSLKQYAKRLKEEIGNNTSSDDVVYDAKFSLIQDEIPLPSPLDSDPLKVC